MNELERFGIDDARDAKTCGGCAHLVTDGYHTCGVCQVNVFRSMNAGRDIRSCADICRAAVDALVDEEAHACADWKDWNRG